MGPDGSPFSARKALYGFLLPLCLIFGWLAFVYQDYQEDGGSEPLNTWPIGAALFALLVILTVARARDRFTRAGIAFLAVVVSAALVGLATATLDRTGYQGREGAVRGEPAGPQDLETASSVHERYGDNIDPIFNGVVGHKVGPVVPGEHPEPDDQAFAIVVYLNEPAPGAEYSLEDVPLRFAEAGSMAP